jgi:hypothetical protein
MVPKNAARAQQRSHVRRPSQGDMRTLRLGRTFDAVLLYLMLLRENGEARAVHDRHETGLFPRATWLRLLTGAGFTVESVRRPIGDGETDEVFLCRRPTA